jgi:hypothetical protein
MQVERLRSPAVPTDPSAGEMPGAPPNKKAAPVRRF